ncbi:60S acidic ribosomal protein P2-like [Cucumis melo var. makuwa]|uniref:60S acidic ribosomal protein P2-like n=1 Tax=Cucumis melo var. makuwa TaxID=1194695 RepID=A0A5A7SLD3_CUCMM|nr:60S acidic ribosomal protein P2-like [Cucumis melo var. makuwa]TYK07392.1 60S acidic ribosomal protein P2-like [Cucumis melo var. makuwa]
MVNICTVGAEADVEKIELLLAEVKGKDITELIACGREKMASLPTGAVVAAVVAAVPSTVDAAAPVAAEAKKEEKDDAMDSDEDICFSLFEDE